MHEVDGGEVDGGRIKEERRMGMYFEGGGMWRYQNENITDHRCYGRVESSWRCVNHWVSEVDMV